MITPTAAVRALTHEEAYYYHMCLEVLAKIDIVMSIENRAKVSAALSEQIDPNDPEMNHHLTKMIDILDTANVMEKAAQ